MKHPSNGRAGNKARTYILYAFGEIFLVVVGILIALQVNNWNENRKNRAQEQVIISNIAKELKSDTIRIQSNLELIQEIGDYANWLRMQIDTKAPYTSRMDTAFAKISVFEIREPNYAVFNNLENIGISIVHDDSLRNEILHYYDEYVQLAEIDDYFEINKYFRQVIYPKHFKNYRYAQYVIPIDRQAIYENSEISIVLDYAINDADYYRTRLMHMQDVANNLLLLIEKNLD